MAKANGTTTKARTRESQKALEHFEYEVIDGVESLASMMYVAKVAFSSSENSDNHLSAYGILTVLEDQLGHLKAMIDAAPKQLKTESSNSALAMETIENVKKLIDVLHPSTASVEYSLSPAVISVIHSELESCVKLCAYIDEERRAERAAA